MAGASEYQDQMAREAKHWGDRLKVEKIEWYAWLDHPLIGAHYRTRKIVDGLQWEDWVKSRLGRAAEHSMELGCGSASRSMLLFERALAASLEGIYASPDRVAVAEQLRTAARAPGGFRVADANLLTLARNRYDLIFSCHSFHHFTALEQILDEVSAALTSDGLFVLEEFVGPTQFQWTDRQIDLVRALTALLPERLRVFRWGAVKTFEGRPTPEQVVAVSPFESIRSGEIAALFEQKFEIVAV